MDDVLECNLTIDGTVNNTHVIYIQNNTNTSYNVSGFTDGLFYWNATCWDNASNINTSLKWNFTIAEPPSVSLGNPENGYWTKKAVGKEITVPILPEALSRSLLIDLSELQRNIRDTERRKASSLPTPKKPLDFYPLLKGIKASLSKPSHQYDFILNQTYDDNRVLRLDVSLEQIDRSIGILHLVLSAFDEHGWKVKVGKPKYEKRLMNTVTVDNVDIQFRLRERLIQKKRELSSKEKLDKASNKWIWKENINVPSGRLQLYIDGPMPKGFKSVFEDKPTQSLEFQLGIFVEHLIVCSEHSRRLAEERRIRDLEWQAEQSRRAEFERAVKTEQQRIESLLGMVAKWQRAN